MADDTRTWIENREREWNPLHPDTRVTVSAGELQALKIGRRWRRQCRA